MTVPIRRAAVAFLASLSACAVAVQGSPAIGERRPSGVFESGIGGGADEWSTLLAQVRDYSVAFAHDRPGYDGGALAPTDSDGVRDADEAARILKMRLDSAGVPTPYILVGHSLGGLYVLRFAKLFPGDVAALVLVDPRLPGFTAHCAAAALPCATPRSWPANTPGHILVEANGMLLSDQLAPSPEELGDIPVTLLTRGTGGPLEQWQASHSDFLGGLANGRQIIARKSGHYIHRDEPQLVLDEIRRAITASR